MSNARSSKPPPAQGMQRLISRFINSRAGARIANFGPIAFSIRMLTRQIARRAIQHGAVTGESVERIAYADLDSTLKAIVTDVVETLGYVGAFVATYESDGALPMRAWYIDPAIASQKQVQQWEAQVSRFSPERPFSLSNPIVARVYVDRPEYEANLSVQAFHKQKPVVGADIYDLLRPVLSEATRPTLRGIQDALGVQQVMAVPFFIETLVDGVTTREFVGNLFALSQRVTTTADQQVLAAFGRQVAASILSERRRSQTQAVLRLIFDIQNNMSSEEQILQQIVKGVVNHLGYVAAMVATYEPDNSLAVRAWSIDPTIGSEEQVRLWEKQVSKLNPEHPISLNDPQAARVYVDDPAYCTNLSVKAFKRQGPVTSPWVFDLFRPVIQDSAMPLIEGIQDALDVRQVIAVPFFLDAFDNANGEREFVGNLFAMSHASTFSSAEIEMLQAFGQQAAAGLHNASLYERAESRRKAAEIFGKMAFTASASVHDLKNKVGIISGNLQVLKLLPVEQLPAVLDELTEPVFRNLSQMADMLDTLHEPWHQVPDTQIDINACLQKALFQVIPNGEQREHMVELALAEELPQSRGSRDMMVEALKVIIKNGVEAIGEKGNDGLVRVVTTHTHSGAITVSISDNGIGIRPEDLGKIFEMRWSTKKGSGLGFGLFWARDYIEGLDGTISVKSVYGEGTTFHISIPATQ